MPSVTSQGSILNSHLFNIYIHEIFMLSKTTHFTSYTDNSMPFVLGDDTTDALKSFE